MSIIVSSALSHFILFYALSLYIFVYNRIYIYSLLFRLMIANNFYLHFSFHHIKKYHTDHLITVYINIPCFMAVLYYEECTTVIQPFSGEAHLHYCHSVAITNRFNANQQVHMHFLILSLFFVIESLEIRMPSQSI